MVPSLLKLESASPGIGHKATGKADNFFNYGYFKMPQLHKMARGELQLPISNTGAAAGADSADANVRRREGGGAGSRQRQPQPARTTGAYGGVRADSLPHQLQPARTTGA